MTVAPSSPLPPLFDPWLRTLLGAPLPEETQATCSECKMCAAPERGPRALALFDPSIKCCTYLPELHNFLVGAILADESPDQAAGRATVVKRLESRAAVTPFGLGKPRAHTVLYQNKGAEDFGRTTSFRCPHYLEGGLCGVWRHRESTCATWFCKHTRGATGASFWRSTHRLLKSVEHALVKSCVLELDPGHESLELLLHVPSPGPIDEPLDGIVTPDLYARLWGRWSGREVEFYKECSRIVGALSWDQVLARVGPDVRLNAKVVQESFARLNSSVLPDRLVAGSCEVLSFTDESVLVSTYNRLDPVSVPRNLFDALSSFDGRETGEVLGSIERDRRLRLSAALLQRLFDWKLLVRA